jgi:hypothetical protein
MAGLPLDESIRWNNRPLAELAEQRQDQGFQIGLETLRPVPFVQWYGPAPPRYHRPLAVLQFPAANDDGAAPLPQ